MTKQEEATINFLENGYYCLCAPVLCLRLLPLLACPERRRGAQVLPGVAAAML